MIANDKSWKEIFRLLDLQDDETMIVSCNLHTINLYYKKGIYRIYDPNYPEGFKEFSNETQLIDELHMIFTLEGSPTLGLELYIVRHPENLETRVYPDSENLYKKYLIPEETMDNRLGCRRDNLKFAVSTYNLPLWNEIKSRGIKFDNMDYPLYVAVSSDSLLIFEEVLNELPHLKEQEVKNLFIFIISMGKLQTFEHLLRAPQFNKYFKEQILREENFAEFIRYAVKGGSAELLNLIIDYYKMERKKTSLTLSEIATLIGVNSTKKDLIELALRERSPTCLTQLIAMLKETRHEFSEKKLFKYLIIAIIMNQPAGLDVILNLIKSELSLEQQKNMFQSVKLSLKDIEFTDSASLRQLQSCGVPFSSHAEGIICQKELQPVTPLLSIGIKLRLFTDFLKEKIFGTTSVLLKNIESFKAIKREFSSVKVENQNIENPIASQNKKL